MAKRKAKRKRRVHSDEFKQEAVQMCQEPGTTMAEVSRNLGVHYSLLRKWKLQMAEEKQQQNRELSEAERLELARLREENKRLRMERDLLKKAAAFFAKESP